MNLSLAPVQANASTEQKRSETKRAAYLTNILAPYWKPTFELLAERLQLRILLSTTMESNRPWEVDWGNLDVALQRTITLRKTWKHPNGFAEPIYVHFPVDTIAQLRRFRPDIVLSNEMGFRTLMACMYRKFARGSRLLVVAEISESTERGRGLLRAALRRVICKYVDGFLVLGQSGKRYIHSLGVPHTKIYAIGYTTDLDRFCNLSLARSEPEMYRLLYVGQLIERKGLAPFLQILSQWAADHPTREVEFTIVGDGPARDSLEKTSLPANLSLSFCGNLAFVDLPRIYAKCGIFAFPTLADTWGVVVNESMAAGLPVLGSIYSQAVEEMVEDGRHGWTFRPDDADGVYRVIHKAMSTSHEMLSGMRIQARERAMQYSPETVAANINEALNRVVSEA